ncbi:MAG: hypothetical protein AABZ45_10935 [Pseudomonadota bacterium]
MNWLVILLIVVSAGFVLFSLIRGLVYFLRASDAVREGGQEGGGPSEMHLMQNKMMFARVKWQAITILLLIVLGFVASAR